MKKSAIIEKIVIKKVHAGNKINFSNNINEVIRTVLNFLLFYCKKISHAPKSANKHQKAQRSTKMHQKAQKSTPKAQKSNQAKVQNANKRIKIKNALKIHLRGE